MLLNKIDQVLATRCPSWLQLRVTNGALRELHRLGNPAFSGCFLWPRLSLVAPHSAPDGVGVVSIRTPRIRLGSRSLCIVRRVAVGLGAIGLRDKVTTKDAGPWPLHAGSWTWISENG